MNVAIVTLGDFETDVDMIASFGIGVLVPRQAADHVTALLHRLVEKFRRARIPGDALLREGHDLDIAILPEFFAGEQQTLRRAQSADGADIRKQTEKGRAVLDARPRAPGSRAATSAGSYLRLNSLVISIASGSVPDRFGRITSPSKDLSAWRCRLNKPGQHEASGGVDLLATFAVGLRPNGRDAVLLD